MLQANVFSGLLRAVSYSVYESAFIADDRTSPETESVASTGALPSLNCGRDNRNLFGASYLGDFGRASADGGFSGYSANHNGALLGYTRVASNCLQSGLYAGFTNSTTDFRSISADAKAPAGHFGLYGRYTAGDLRATLDGNFSFANNTVNRHPAGTSVTSASFTQQAGGIGGEFAYDFRPNAKTVLTPFLGLRQTWLRQEGFTEQGGLMPQKVDPFTGSSFASVLGGKLSRDFDVCEGARLTPSLTAGWRYEWGDRQFSTTSMLTEIILADPIPYAIYSRKESRDAALLGAALDWAFRTANGHEWRLAAAYAADIRPRAVDHSLAAKVEITF